MKFPHAVYTLIERNSNKGASEIADLLLGAFPELGREKEQWRTFVKARKGRAVSEGHPALAEECEDVGIPVQDVKQYWYKGEHFSIQARPNQVSYLEARDMVIEEMKAYAPKYPTIRYIPPTEPHLVVLNPADVHIGKLCEAFETGEEYNCQIAVQRVKEGIKGVLNKSLPYGIDQILLVIGNDILHTDTPRRTTTSGTPQDTDGMWYSNFLMAKRLYVEILEMCLAIAPTAIHFNPSNHDYMSGFFLADSIQSWFHKVESATFNVNTSHRKYYAYGRNLIGTTHGDGAKTDILPNLMTEEASEHWHYCKHRYFYTAHLHHKISKDYMSVCVETLRSVSGTDSWHHQKGYQYAPKAIEAFIHHREFGQVARFSHLF